MSDWQSVTVTDRVRCAESACSSSYFNELKYCFFQVIIIEKVIRFFMKLYSTVLVKILHLMFMSNNYVIFSFNPFHILISLRARACP